VTPVQHLVVPTEDVLSALTAEIAVAQAACARLDGALVGVLETSSPEQRGVLLGELHAVDRLHQQMQALHTFLGRVGCGESLLEIGQALPAITLAEVADRMGAVLSVSATEGPPPPDGDCEYF
jgi:hypothetical protein